jgi:hypothetical protein
MTFTGHSVAIVGSRGPSRGKAKVYIDGVYYRTISTKSATSVSRQVLFSYSFAGGGTHTIALVPTGTGTHRLVRVDAFVVGR